MLRFAVVSRHQHPDVVHRGAEREVVEVEEEPALATAQQIAEVAVAVDAQQRDAFEPLGVDVGERLDGRGVALLARRRQPGAVEQFVERIEECGVGVEHRSIDRLLHRADVVDAREQSPESPQLVVGELVGLAAAGARPHAEADARLLSDGAAAGQRKRCADGNLGCPQIQQKAVLVLDAGATPAPGPVELHHHVCVVFEAQIPDAVLETAQHPAVSRGPQTRRAGGVERRVGAEIRELGKCHGAGA